MHTALLSRGHRITELTEEQYRADIESGLLQDAMLCVRQAWNTQCYTKEGQLPPDRLVVYTFEGTLMIQRADSTWRPVPVNQAIDTLLRHLGATQKVGPPPPLRRAEAQEADDHSLQKWSGYQHFVA